MVFLQKLLTLSTWVGLGCAPELVLTVETDAPSYTDIQRDSALSHDAVVDRLRIDVYDPLTQHYLDTCEFVVADAADWPRSFGIAAKWDRVQVRFRAFRAALSPVTEHLSTLAVCGRPTQGQKVIVTSPPDEVTIDRLIEVSLPKVGRVEKRVLLSLSCIGASADFSQRTSCKDFQNPRVPIDADTDDPAAEGVSVLAKEQLCTKATPVGIPGEPIDALCIPGGLTVMGDLSLGNRGMLLDSHPLRVVLLSPFYIDRYEFSVGKLVALRNRCPACVSEPATEVLMGSDGPCMWKDPANNQQMPLNCIEYAEANRACEQFGKANGRLPTEAQFEHAARGRGRGFRFPWGFEWPTCERASLGRSTPLRPGDCPGNGPDPIDKNTGDVSYDRVVALAGNMGEMVRDRAMSYKDRCGLKDPRVTLELDLDPLCWDKRVEGTHVLRGSGWSGGSMTGGSAVRQSSQNNLLGPSIGFRCVYDGT